MNIEAQIDYINDYNAQLSDEEFYSDSEECLEIKINWMKEGF